MRGKNIVILGFSLLFISFGASAQYWSSADVATFLYKQASHNNSYIISQTLDSGYDIDADVEGGKKKIRLS